MVDEAGRNINIPPPWQLITAGDMNGDGKSDLVWHNNTTHGAQVWFMNGPRMAGRATVVDEAGTNKNIAPPWRIVGSAMFNALR